MAISSYPKLIAVLLASAVLLLSVSSCGRILEHKSGSASDGRYVDEFIAHAEAFDRVVSSYQADVRLNSPPGQFDMHVTVVLPDEFDATLTGLHEVGVGSSIYKMELQSGVWVLEGPGKPLIPLNPLPNLKDASDVHITYDGQKEVRGLQCEQFTIRVIKTGDQESFCFSRDDLLLKYEAKSNSHTLDASIEYYGFNDPMTQITPPTKFVVPSPTPATFHQ
jgi:hypothetical protein